MINDHIWAGFVIFLICPIVPVLGNAIGNVVFGGDFDIRSITSILSYGIKKPIFFEEIAKINKKFEIKKNYPFSVLELPKLLVNAFARLLRKYLRFTAGVLSMTLIKISPIFILKFSPSFILCFPSNAANILLSNYTSANASIKISQAYKNRWRMNTANGSLEFYNGFGRLEKYRKYCWKLREKCSNEVLKDSEEYRYQPFWHKSPINFLDDWKLKSTVSDFNSTADIIQELNIHGFISICTVGNILTPKNERSASNLFEALLYIDAWSVALAENDQIISDLSAEMDFESSNFQGAQNPSQYSILEFQDVDLLSQAFSCLSYIYDEKKIKKTYQKLKTFFKFNKISVSDFVVRNLNKEEVLSDFHNLNDHEKSATFSILTDDINEEYLRSNLLYDQSLAEESFCTFGFDANEKDILSTLNTRFIDIFRAFALSNLFKFIFIFWNPDSKRILLSCFALFLITPISLYLTFGQREERFCIMNSNDQSCNTEMLTKTDCFEQESLKMREWRTAVANIIEYKGSVEVQTVQCQFLFMNISHYHLKNLDYGSYDSYSESHFLKIGDKYLPETSVDDDTWLFPWIEKLAKNESTIIQDKIEAVVDLKDASFELLVINDLKYVNSAEIEKTSSYVIIEADQTIDLSIDAVSGIICFNNTVEHRSTWTIDKPVREGLIFNIHGSTLSLHENTLYLLAPFKYEKMKDLEIKNLGSPVVYKNKVVFAISGDDKATVSNIYDEKYWRQRTAGLSAYSTFDFMNFEEHKDQFQSQKIKNSEFELYFPYQSGKMRAVSISDSDVSGVLAFSYNFFGKLTLFRLCIRGLDEHCDFTPHVIKHLCFSSLRIINRYEINFRDYELVAVGSNLLIIGGITTLHHEGAGLDQETVHTGITMIKNPLTSPKMIKIDDFKLYQNYYAIIRPWIRWISWNKFVVFYKRSHVSRFVSGHPNDGVFLLRNANDLGHLFEQENGGNNDGNEEASELVIQVFEIKENFSVKLLSANFISNISSDYIVL